MKIYIGPYRNWFGPYQIAKTILFWMDKDGDTVDKFYNWLAFNKDGKDSQTSKFCRWIAKKHDRRIKVRIDHYETWGMDHTLAYIILPMLKQLKATKHGSPYVDQNDLPADLRLTKREQKVFNEGHWNKKIKATEEEIDAASKKFHAQFDWVLDQMIWSFEQQFLDDEGRSNYYDPYGPDEEVEEDAPEKIINDNGTVTETAPLFGKVWRREMGKFNNEKHKVYQEKKQLGFTLFGKYFQSLWD